jgi:hypothetical protein
MLHTVQQELPIRQQGQGIMEGKMLNFTFSRRALLPAADLFRSWRRQKALREKITCGVHSLCCYF